jgi:hypothetical protein
MPNGPEEIWRKWNGIPDWDKMVYLYRWCESLEETVQQQREEIRLLQGRLVRVESRTV